MYSVPGLILGFMINFVCRNAAIVALFYFADYGTPIDLQNRTIILVRMSILNRRIGSLSWHLPSDVLEYCTDAVSIGEATQKCFESSKIKWR
jgi:hypothetical protein